MKMGYRPFYPAIGELAGHLTSLLAQDGAADWGRKGRRG